MALSASMVAEAGHPLPLAGAELKINLVFSDIELQLELFEQEETNKKERI